MRHLARYLRRSRDVMISYPFGMPIGMINVHSDSDWAGNRYNRRSVSGGCLFLGRYLLKTWSKEQEPIALSSGEAELYAANKAAREGIGAQSIARDIGLDTAVKVYIDASAAEGIMQRRGLGKMRHVHTQDIWTQKAIKDGKFELGRIHTKASTADIGTKPLGRNDVESLLRQMGCVCCCRGCE